VTYANKFEYGYAITCHLSQGSQYNKVLVYNEYMGDREYYSKWLYTAITRAIDKLVVAY
jgi:exodeoxyribonuclease-5